MLTDLTVTDFTLFSQATFRFGALNVVHGANSSGKTHLLKLAYSLTSALAPRPNDPAPDQPTKTYLEAALGAKLGAVFRPDKNKIGRLARRVQGTKRAEVSATLDSVGELSFDFSTRSDRAVSITSVPAGWLAQSPIYLPTRELLSIYTGFVSLYETQVVPFDETWRDTCLLLGAPIARGPKKKEIAELLAPLEEAIDCKALLEGDRFYLQMQTPKAKVEADLVAEGFRKLSMVARLIANGSLDDKGYLFWDEPEANLNAQLVRRLAPLLIDLAAGGVQVFLATHSLFLMRELEIELTARGRQVVDTRFIGLHPGPDGVAVDQGPVIEDSGDIAVLDESLAQSERYLAAVEP
ncbi:MAG: ATP-binding protein [Myxococcales bacterium]|nr:ATP-binding protein [Myxococcales bacterium]